MARPVFLERPQAATAATALALEQGAVVAAPAHGFALQAAERPLLRPGVAEPKTKNVSLDPLGRLSGAAVGGAEAAALAAMTARFAAWAEDFVHALAPRYAGALQRRRTSFRPRAVSGEALSARKDDRRLHVDAFPANPVQGRRILRVFANVDPAGGERVWNVGDDDFAAFAGAFQARLAPRADAWRANAWRAAVGLTKGRRTAYDAAMLQLHDAAKLDDAWQASAARTEMRFSAGSSWVVFTDSVLHAALAGQFALEQTFLLPVEAMGEPARSPLWILEGMTGRALV